MSLLALLVGQTDRPPYYATGYPIPVIGIITADESWAPDAGRRRLCLWKAESEAGSVRLAGLVEASPPLALARLPAQNHGVQWMPVNWHET
jgi:hypothetical protein